MFDNGRAKFREGLEIPTSSYFGRETSTMTEEAVHRHGKEISFVIMLHEGVELGIEAVPVQEKC